MPNTQYLNKENTMNFDLENLFGGGMAKLSALENCENSWKKLIKNPNQEEFWEAAISAYFSKIF